MDIMELTIPKSLYLGGFHELSLNRGKGWLESIELGRGTVRTCDNEAPPGVQQSAENLHRPRRPEQDRSIASPELRRVQETA